MKKYFFLYFLFFLTYSVFSQTKDLGKPYLLTNKVEKINQYYITPKVNNHEEIEKTIKHKSGEAVEKNFRFGKEHLVSIDIFSSSNKTVLPSGDLIYQFGIKAKNAVSINLVFDEFELAKGVNLYMVDLIHEQYVGAYTSLNNNPSKMLGTELLKSDEIILEIYVPKEQDGKSLLRLNTIVHGFQDIDTLAKSLNNSGNCQVDVNCPLGDEWKNQRNSVAMMVNGGGFCTGSLVNNTSGNIIPYFLSARHCGTNPGGWFFRFRYESPEGQVDCGTAAPSIDGPATMNINGATLCSNFSASDFTLSLLNSTPDPNWGVYYNGWDRRDVPATELTCIHHPSGDVKKISVDYSSAVSSSFSGIEQNSHWKAPSWDFGATEGGSSGSPLFDQNHRTIGQLQGGNSYCGAASNDLNDAFGKFSRSWTGGGTTDSRLSDWLDPINLGSLFIDGVDPLVAKYTTDGGVSNVQANFLSVCGESITPSFTIFNNGIDTLFGATIQYGFDGDFSSYFVTDTLVTFQTLDIVLPDTSLENGNHTFQTIFNYTLASDENSENDTASYSFSLNLEGMPLFLDLSIYCDASENRWEIANDSQVVVASGGPFSDGLQVPLLDSFCLVPNCYTFKLYDTYGDGISSLNCDPGNYSIKDENGIVFSELQSEDADFGTLLSSPFCASIDTKNPVNSIKIYPNPGNSILKIVAYNYTFDNVRITSLTGQIVHEIETFKNQAQVDVSNFSKGIYLIHFQSASEKIVKSIVVN